MTVVSSKEFVGNQEKYFDMAVSSDVYIKNGSYMFHILRKKRNGTVIENNPYTLSDMLSKITDSNTHQCIETGEPVGNEAW